MNLNKIIEEYQKLGYSYRDAVSQTAQDIIMYKISNTKFGSHIVFKGGVVMHGISKNERRATRDIDFDFIKYSLADEYIYKFIDTLNITDDGVFIEVVGAIKELKQQDYHGRRLYINLTDKYGFSIGTKLDIGVEKNFDKEQDEFCFELNVIGKNANLLINSPEQIFAEKLKSLLKLGFRSTRYKDVFDFCYLINENKLNKEKVYHYINAIIFNDSNTKENNTKDIVKRLKLIFYHKTFNQNLTNPKDNWLDISVDEAIKIVLNYIEILDTIIA